jgi:hypothetical protein
MGKRYLPATPKEFWEACDKTENCWFYKYPFFTKFQGRLRLAHRLAWEIHHKRILTDKFTLVLHSCEEPKCVNPKHLFLGTGRDVESHNSTPKEFWKRVDKKNGPVLNKKLGRCWIWTGGMYNHGIAGLHYGQVQYHKVAYAAHRLAWILTNGPVPKNTKQVCHKCDNPPCVRPSHLFCGTPKDNTQDMIAKGRFRGVPKGFKHTSETIANMCAAAKLRKPHFGQKFSDETKAKMRQSRIAWWERKRTGTS